MSLRGRLFWYGSCLAARRNKLVVVCAAYCHMALVFAVMHLYTIFNFSLLCPLLFYTLKKCPVLINRRNGPRYQRVQVLCAFFNWGNTKGTNSSEKDCLMFVYIFSTFVSGLILLFLNNLWFDDLRAGLKKKKRRQIEHCF